MSDEHISETPNPPRCPVCATGFTATPGASCPACGRTFAPPAIPDAPDVRRDHSGGRSTLFGWTACALIAGSSLLALAAFAWAYTDSFVDLVSSPGLYILLALLLVPVAIRMIGVRPATKDAASRGHLFGALLTSVGVAALAGLASVVTFGIVCFAVFARSTSLESLFIGAGAGGVAGIVVFLLIFLRLWPRQSAGVPPRSRDPEN